MHLCLYSVIETINLTDTFETAVIRYLTSDFSQIFSIAVDKQVCSINYDRIITIIIEIFLVLLLLKKRVKWVEKKKMEGTTFVRVAVKLSIHYWRFYILFF